jgi:hypothetical protein
MATDKKSFILYCDLIHTVNKLPDETAGKLLKHILAYVNDLNPETEDLLVEVAFEPIKQAMKRDLKKWETEINRKSQGAILGNLKRWHLDLYEKVDSKELTLDEAQTIAKGRIPSHTDKSDGIATKSIASIADSVNVSVNDSVSVSVNVNEKENNNIPNWDDFLAYAVDKKPKVNRQDLRLKYEAWFENGWSINRAGKLQPIQNWKTTLLNTLPYIAEVVIKERKIQS